MSIEGDSRFIKWLNPSPMIIDWFLPVAMEDRQLFTSPVLKDAHYTAR